MGWSGRTIGGICMAMIWLSAAACTEPTEGPGKTTVDYLRALQQRSAQDVFTLLDPSDRERVTKLHRNMVSIRRLASAHYTLAERQAIWRKVGVEDFKLISDPQVLFGQLMAKAGTKKPLTTFQRWGTRIRSVDQASASATVRTWGNDTVVLREVAGQWVVRLDDVDRKRLDDLAVDATRILDQLKMTIRQLESQHRYGGSTTGS
jgi:hypothetical protein